MLPMVLVLADARLGRDQRAGDAVAEQLLVGGGAALGADELPPADLFVLVHAPLAAGGDDLPELGAEERELVVRQAEIAAEKPAEVVECDAHVVDRARESGR